MGLKDGFWRGREVKSDAEVKDPALRGGKHNSGKLKTGDPGRASGRHRAPGTDAGSRDPRDVDRGRDRS